MDSFELNKIIGAILGTLLFVMGAGFLAEAIYHPIEGRGPGYTLPEPEGEGGEAAPEEEVAQASIGTLLASANPDQGAQAVSRCKGCHNFEQGAGSKQGPELYGIAGRQIASMEGFSYSSSLSELGAAGETWTYEHLNDFLLAPKGFAPDTKMNFGGVKDDAERANIIAYLASISPDAPPFPAPEPAAGEADEAAAAGEAASAGEAPAAGESNAESVETPSEQQGETAVEGTPVSPTEPTTEPAPAAGAAPSATEPAPAETVGPGASTGQ